MSSSVKYLCDEFPNVTFSRQDVPRYGMLQLAPGQSPSGYGKKISTDYMATVNGRKHRVYCVCFSNAGSLYVVKGGEAYYVRDYDIPDSVR